MKRFHWIRGPTDLRWLEENWPGFAQFVGQLQALTRHCSQKSISGQLAELWALAQAGSVGSRRRRSTGAKATPRSSCGCARLRPAEMPAYKPLFWHSPGHKSGSLNKSRARLRAPQERAVLRTNYDYTVCRTRGL